MADTIDLSGIQDTVPRTALVSEPQPLTGKEKAGVKLTWGLLWFIGVFIVLVLGIFLWGECRYFGLLKDLDTTLNANPTRQADIKLLIDALNSKQDAFRAFWLEILKLGLLNVLFPTLTALLGYVFGTSKVGSST